MGIILSLRRAVKKGVRILEVYGRIYGIENMLNHKICVGQTIRPLKERLWDHRKCKTSLIGRAIQKYGWENFVAVVLEECYSLEELNQREMYWIARLNCKAPFGYNLTDGGEGTGGFKLSKESVAKLIAAKTGKKPGSHSAEWNEKIRQSLLGHPVSESAREKVSAANTGRVHSREVVLSNSQKIRNVIYPNFDRELNAKNLLYKDLAQLLGISKSTISMKLSWHLRMDEKTALALQEILQTNLSVEELFWHED